MKILLLLLVTSLFSPSIFAFQCRTNGGQEFRGGTQNIYDVPIDNDIFAVPNRINEFADVSDFMTCRNEAPFAYVDYLNVTGASLGPAFRNNPELKAGVVIRGAYYLAPFSGREIPVFRLTTATEPLPIKLYLQVNVRPTPSVLVRKGDLLMTLDLHKYATFINSNQYIDHFYYRWNFYSGNDVVVGTGTCDINNNQIIIVDFEMVNASGISTVGSASRFQRNVELTYSCEDNNLTAPIKMTLSGETSTFSSDALLIRTGDIGNQGPIMRGLGVEVYHQGQRVSPMNGSFNSKIENGRGRDTLMFTLVKKPNLSPNELTEGQFNSAATIIMSTP
ncbi:MULTISPECIES: fimbrial protein [Providencia]|uniref:fimbrial protein n=1 Tax=Providencia TaxID=586 RepID=UPI0034DD9B75